LVAEEKLAKMVETVTARIAAVMVAKVDSAYAAVLLTITVFATGWVVLRRSVPREARPAGGPFDVRAIGHADARRRSRRRSFGRRSRARMNSRAEPAR